MDSCDGQELQEFGPAVQRDVVRSEREEARATTFISGPEHLVAAVVIGRNAEALRGTGCTVWPFVDALRLHQAHVLLNWAIETVISWIFDREHVMPCTWCNDAIHCGTSHLNYGP